MGQWLFPSKNPNNSPPATRLRIQSSIQGMVRPIVWGQTRLAGNLIDYQDFGSFQVQSGGGGGGKGGSGGSGGKGGATNTNYSATVVVGLCEGPIAGVLSLWTNKGFNIGLSGWAIFTGGYSQTAWSYMSTKHPANALNYRGLAYVAFANYALQTSPELPQFGWEVLSNISFAYAGTASPNSPPDNIKVFYNGNYPPIVQGSTPLNATTALPDANPRDIIVDFLTNAHYGVGWPSNRIDTTMSAFSSQCLALGLVMSFALIEATAGQAFLDSIVQAAIATFRWSNGILSVVPWFDQAITSGSQTQITQTGQAIPVVNGPSGFPQVQIAQGTFVANVKVQASGGGAVYTQLAYGTFIPSIGHQQYVVSPTGIYYFSSGDGGSNVDITYDVAAQASYQPFNTPIYNINLDFLPNQGASGAVSADGPVMCVRKPNYYLYNSVRLEWLDRNNNYDPSVVEIKDQASIDAFTVKARAQTSAHMFSIGAAATISGILQLGRERIANTYTFTVGPQYILLEVEDIVTITRTVMGLNAQAVRIMEIQENADFSLTITAEEYFGTVTAPMFGSQLPSGLANNYNADPGNIAQPMIFEVPATLGQATGSGSEFVVAAAVCGLNMSVWGGCEVWASVDGVTYAHFGTIKGASRMGVLTSVFNSVTPQIPGPTIDTSSTLAVDLTMSLGTLLSASPQDFAANDTLCYVANSTAASVPGEVITYETATLSTTNKYNLTTLGRAIYQSNSTGIVSHPSGAQFARLDPVGIFYQTFNPSFVGQTINFKFQSFNHWGGGLQNLSALGAYPYVIQGAALGQPLPNVTNLRAYFEGGFMKLYWDEVVDFRVGIQYEIRKGASFGAAVQIGVVAHPPFVVFGNDTYWVTARVQVSQTLLVYSSTPQSIAVGGQTLVAPFVVKSFDEQATGWTGTFTPLGTLLQYSTVNATAGLKIFNSNQTAANSTTAAGSEFGFSVNGSSGKLYFEASLDALSTGSSLNAVGIGFASTTFSGTPAAWLGDDAGKGSVSLFTNGSVWFGGSSIFASTALAYSTVATNIGCAINPASALVWFRINGGPWNGSTTADPGSSAGGISLASLVSTAYYPTANLRVTQGSQVSVIGPGLQYPIPSGYTALSTAGLIEQGVNPSAVVLTSVGSTGGFYEVSSNHWINVGYVPKTGVSVNASYTPTGAPIGQNILTVANILTDPDVLGSQSAQFVDVHLELAQASSLASTVTQTPAWGAWQKFVPGVYNSQYYKMRASINTISTNVQAFLEAFVWSAQVNLRIDHYTVPMSTTADVQTFYKLDGSTSTVAYNQGSTGSTVNPNYGYAITNWQSGDSLTIGSIDLTQFSISVFNAGVRVNRTVNFDTEGF